MELTCSRCGVKTPRLTLDQHRCPPCQQAVEQVIRMDTARRTRFSRAVDLTPALAA